MITPGCWIPASRGVVLFCIKFVFQNGSINTSYLYQVIILNITVRQSRQSGVARATCPD